MGRLAIIEGISACCIYVNRHTLHPKRAVSLSSSVTTFGWCCPCASLHGWGICLSSEMEQLGLHAPFQMDTMSLP